jgi:hypothetical protein
MAKKLLIWKSGVTKAKENGLIKNRANALRKLRAARQLTYALCILRILKEK